MYMYQICYQFQILLDNLTHHQRSKSFFKATNVKQIALSFKSKCFQKFEAE